MRMGIPKEEGIYGMERTENGKLKEEDPTNNRIQYEAWKIRNEEDYRRGNTRKWRNIQEGIRRIERGGIHNMRNTTRGGLY